jgi:hypothetical protein
VATRTRGKRRRREPIDANNAGTLLFAMACPVPVRRPSAAMQEVNQNADLVLGAEQLAVTASSESGVLSEQSRSNCLRWRREMTPVSPN